MIVNEIENIINKMSVESGKLQDALLADLDTLKSAGIIFTECAHCNQLQYTMLGDKKTITEDEQKLINAVYTTINELYVNYAIDFRAILDLKQRSVSYTFDVDEAKLRSLLCMD